MSPSRGGGDAERHVQLIVKFACRESLTGGGLTIVTASQPEYLKPGNPSCQVSRTSAEPASLNMSMRTGPWALSLRMKRYEMTPGLPATEIRAENVIVAGHGPRYAGGLA